MIRPLALLALSWALVVIAPAFAFEGIRMTFLAADAAAGHDAASTLIEAGDQTILVGCVQGVVERLRRRGIAPGDLAAIFLIDLAPRHVAGCRELWQTAAMTDAALPTVWGPPGTAALFRRLDADLGIAANDGTAAFDIADNVVYQPEAMTVTAFVAGGGRFGYRIDAFRRSVAIAGGGPFSENVARNVRNAQVLLQELDVPGAASGKAVEDEGSSPDDAGRLFRAARPTLAVYANVMRTDAEIEDAMRRTRRNYAGAVQVARDMLVIEIQNEVQVRGAPSSGN